MGIKDYAKEGAATSALVRGQAAGEYAAKVWPTIKALRKAGKSYRDVASRLNETNTPSPTGKKWHMESVRKIAIRFN